MDGYFSPDADPYYATRGYAFAIFATQIDRLPDLDLDRRERERSIAAQFERERQWDRERAEQVALVEAERKAREAAGLPDPLIALRAEIERRYVPTRATSPRCIR